VNDQPIRDIVFVDTETNGLDDRMHDAWDVAAWNLTTGHRIQFFADIPDMSTFLARSDPKALRVNRFLDRYPLDGPCPTYRETTSQIEAFREVLSGGRVGTRAEMDALPLPVLVGSKPSFDEGFLRRLFVRHKFSDPAHAKTAEWHHHPIDLGAYAAGVIGVEPGTTSLSARAVATYCGIPVGDHSADGDVTSGGRAFLLLREAARRGAQGGSARMYLDAHGLVGDEVEAELLRPLAVAT